MPKICSAMIFSVFLAHGQPAGNIRSADIITTAHVWTDIQPYLMAAGDRYSKPGNERITGAGTISRGEPAKVAATSVVVTWEFPGKIRFDEAGGPSSFNSSAPVQSGLLSPSLNDLIETLVEDTFDGFLSAHAGDSSTRVLGKGFRWQDHPGQFVDIVQITSKSNVKATAALTTKEYRFDSGTKLLLMATYRSASKAQVEVTFSNWQNIQGQLIPKTIVRTENGSIVFSLNLGVITVGAKSNDGKFGN